MIGRTFLINFFLFGVAPAVALILWDFGYRFGFDLALVDSNFVIGEAGPVLFFIIIGFLIGTKLEKRTKNGK